MRSHPTTPVRDFLDRLAPERRAAIERTREVVLANLPPGYEEDIVKETLVYQVPLSVYPDTYNGHPLWYVAMASMKSYMSLYLLAAYGSPPLMARLKDGFSNAGKKLTMGKSCINFTSIDDLELGVIGEVVAAVPMETFVAAAKAARRK